MIYSLTWLAPVLGAAGLKVAEIPGWESRGRAQMGNVLGVMCHHTAGLPTGNMPALNTLVNGRPDLAGPLAQLGLGRDGTFYVIAAGLCNHAGIGSYQGVANRGNSNFIGIEAENTGAGDDKWPDVQLDAFRRGIAAILSHLGLPVQACIAHKEYAPGRKFDPDFNMDVFRQGISDIMSGAAPAPKPIPAVEPPPPAGGQTPRPTLRRGAANIFVTAVQKALNVNQSGIFDGVTEAAVRVLQRGKGLVPDGIVGPKTWQVLDAIRATSSPAVAPAPANGDGGSGNVGDDPTGAGGEGAQ